MERFIKMYFYVFYLQRQQLLSLSSSLSCNLPAIRLDTINVCVSVSIITIQLISPCNFIINYNNTIDVFVSVWDPASHHYYAENNRYNIQAEDTIYNCGFI